MLVMDMKAGILAQHDCESGAEVWRERVAEAAAAGPFLASPVSWRGLAFFVADRGNVFAIRPGDEMEIVAVNSVDADSDEIFRASPTPSEGQIFLRSHSTLYCIGKRQRP